MAEYEEFENWIDDEGGVESLIRHGVDISQVPYDVKQDWIIMNEAFDKFEVMRSNFMDKLTFRVSQEYVENYEE